MAFPIDAATGQHIGDKDEQQDRLAIYQSARHRGTLLAVVADGMGGRTGGAMAAEQTISTAKQLFEHSRGETPEQLLRSIVEDAHTAIRLSRFTSEQEPHSTVVAMLLQPDRADWAHSGDSRLYHFRGRQFLSHTLDHSYVEQLYSEGKIGAGERHTHHQRNLLVSCLGGQDPPLVGMGGTVPLQGGDTFLLCTDGLWSYFSDAELGNALAEDTPRQAAEKLVAEARVRARGRGDNVSLIVIRLG